jgi:hypothetical protein
MRRGDSNVLLPVRLDSIETEVTGFVKVGEPHPLVEMAKQRGSTAAPIYSLGPKIRVTRDRNDTLCLAFATTFTTVQKILMNGKDQCIH